MLKDNPVHLVWLGTFFLLVTQYVQNKLAFYLILSRIKSALSGKSQAIQINNCESFLINLLTQKEKNQYFYSCTHRFGQWLGLQTRSQDIYNEVLTALQTSCSSPINTDPIQDYSSVPGGIFLSRVTYLFTLLYCFILQFNFQKHMGGN